METLRELRKFGGFTELEHQHTNTIEGSGKSHGRHKAARKQSWPKRVHPTILLEIIETMILAKNDPKDPILRQRLDEAQPPTEMLSNMIAGLDIPNELDKEIKRAHSLVHLIFEMSLGLNFILARSGRLRIVKVSNDFDALTHAIKQAATKPTPAATHYTSVADLITTYQDQIDNLLEIAAILLSNLVVCNCHNNVPTNSLPNPDNLPAEPDISLKELTARDNKISNPLDQYLMRTIHIAKVAHNVEDYLIALRDFTKKICNTLNISLAQCVVLMSSLAMIA